MTSLTSLMTSLTSLRSSLTARLLRADLARGRAVATTLTALVALACCLVAAATSLIISTVTGTTMLWEQAKPPDVVQMHSGALDEQEVADWAATREDVTDYQVVKTLPAPGQALWIDGVSQADSMLEPAFVTASQDFDLLLSEDGTPADPGPGQVALPVHYQATGQAEVGDTVVVDDGSTRTSLEVVGFVRDAQMNPSMVTSKRLVVSQEDFTALEAQLEEPEYLIELLLAEGARPQSVIDAYTAAGLPSTGVAVEASVFWLMNALSTVLIAAVALLVAVMLVAVALLSLRYTVLAALEADLPQVAVLKAVGVPGHRTERLYLMKYMVLALLGAVVGYLASLPLARALVAPALLYLGTPPTTVWSLVLPAASALAVAGLVIASTWATLRRLRRISAVEALRSGTSGRLARRRHLWSLARARRLPVQVWMGVREACRPSSALLTGILAVCTLTMVLPASAYTTLEDPRFITYLGIGEADIRIDVYSGTGDLAQVEDVVGSETRITHHTTLLSRRYEMAASEGQWESVVVEVGDHDAIPLSYVSGEPPTRPDEVALSTAQAEAVGVETGARVPVRTADGTVELAVTGTYQDITNGGRTAKAVLDDGSPALWQVVYADLEDPQQGDLVVDSLRARLPDAQVRTTEDYASQVLGATSSQLRTVAVLACAVALGLAFLVTTLLTTLLVSRERRATAVLRALGCTRRDVTLQYLTRFMTVALAGLALGGLVAATAGQQAIGGVLSALGGGGAQIHLLARPWLVGGAVPLALAACVAGAVLVALRRLPAPTLTTLGAGE